MPFKNNHREEIAFRATNYFNLPIFSCVLLVKLLNFPGELRILRK